MEWGDGEVEGSIKVVVEGEGRWWVERGGGGGLVSPEGGNMAAADNFQADCFYSGLSLEKTN